MKSRLVVILAIAVFAYSGRSIARTTQPADVKPPAQTDSAASAATQVTEGAQGDCGPSRDNQTVIVALPFSSLELDPSLVEYLSLTSKQIRAIQDLMSQERRELEPLKTELQSTHGKLLAAADQGHSKEMDILAATEARILTKLIIQSSRTQARLHGLLTHEQQKKLEDLSRAR